VTGVGELLTGGQVGSYNDVQLGVAAVRMLLRVAGSMIGGCGVVDGGE
jgi:hypothetical protein